MAHTCLSAARTAAALRPPFQADCSASVFPRPARASSSRPHAHRLIAAAPVVPVPRRSNRALAIVAMASQEEATATAVEEAQEEDVQETTGELKEDEPAGEVEEQQPEEEEEEDQGVAAEASSDGGELASGDGGGAGSEGSSATKLYFGNLPYNCDSALLAGIVQDHAIPQMVEVLYDRTTGRSRGFAFVTMSTLEDCERVIKNLDGTEIEGREIRVNLALGKRY